MTLSYGITSVHLIGIFAEKKYQKSPFKKILPIQGGEKQQPPGSPGEKYLAHRDIRGHFYIGRPIVVPSDGKITL
jgi:hypothetical protein